MTPVVLLEELEKFLNEKTKDLLLPVKPKGNSVSEERPPKIYKMKPPVKTGNEEQVPYLVLQLLTVKDMQKEGENPQCLCKIRIIAATYGEDEGTADMNTLNLLTRVRISLLEKPNISGRLKMLPNTETLIYSDVTPPYSLGEMMTEWSIPAVSQRVEWDEWDKMG